MNTNSKPNPSPLPTKQNAEQNPENTNYAINVHNLNKSFGTKHVVQNVSIEVKKGHITGFLGPNGSGKTTTLRLLCGLLTADSGEGKVLGLNFRKDREQIKRQTGYMTQKFSLYDDLSIEENLVFMARIHELPNYKDKVNITLNRLKLYDRRKQLAGTLSGGWKQRLALATATLHNPKLLLLDEPTAGVDPKARRDFWDEIHDLATGGLTVLVSTHYMDEAERCHDIGYILNGSLIARGSSEEIIKQSKLITFEAECEGSGETIKTLQQQDGVISASAFGKRLHISGLDRDKLLKAISNSHTDKNRWSEVESSLEDVFIYFMTDKKDHRYSE
ncbi:ABC transporter ATP-binding protein [Desulfovibrio litoralis]|uniref:ABC-2 type transport system ATP-binding protein n=1 Tax=Desulfovibrio litoralis DSM 11393 TaxID=1121455 RepID=A0A1M7SQ76_9BACT|nr:ABC transporter ATP-binding protein [Desulfovibrio litoralis]SHN60528.1 ABC-2 type transport system ATP-binding protein [Desulfovibrio litoralis DSM 11393]